MGTQNTESIHSPDDGRTATGRNAAGRRGKPQKGGVTMPDKEKVKEVQTLVDKLDTLPETAKQRILGIAEGIEMANKAAEEEKGA